MSNIKLLDCTLRDGGLTLREQTDKDKYMFTPEMSTGIIEALKNANIDIVELGSVQKIDRNLCEYAIYRGIEDVSALIPREARKGQLYATFFQGPDIPIEDIPEWRPALCDLIRLSIRYSEIEKSLAYCRGLVEKGYKVSVQPIVTMRYSDDELKYLAEVAEKIDAYAIYFVDSYGYMNIDDVERIYHIYDNILGKDIRIGFHAHNNMNNALANVLGFMNINTEREIIVDSCCLGMGQGAGNLQTEIIANILNENGNGCYDFISILKACEYIDGLLVDNAWGYSVPTFISAKYRVAYKYAVILRKQYGLSYSQIASVLEVMPKEFYHRFTEDSLKATLKIANIK